MFQLVILSTVDQVSSFVMIAQYWFVIQVWIIDVKRAVQIQNWYKLIKDERGVQMHAAYIIVCQYITLFRKKNNMGNQLLYNQPTLVGGQLCWPFVDWQSAVCGLCIDQLTIGCTMSKGWPNISHALTEALLVWILDFSCALIRVALHMHL